MKVLCVSENAVEGIENAADHSDGTVVAAACPCFTQADLDAANLTFCDDSSTEVRTFIRCNNGDSSYIFSVEGSFGRDDYRQCISTTPDDGTTTVPSISIDELNACSSLLKQ